MAVTLSQLIADCRNTASSGPTAADFRISDEQIGYWVNEVRSTLINQAIQKKQDFSDVWIQQIKCLDLIPVDIAECCEIDLDCTILRTVKQIPASIETDGNNLIMAVTGVDGTPLQKLNLFRSRFINSSKYTKNKPFWYVKNNYIYIGNGDLLGKISITGIFENPADLASYNTCDGVPCYTKDSNYPVSLKMASMITDIIIQTKVRPFLTFNQDTSNDSKDQSIPLGK